MPVKKKKKTKQTSYKKFMENLKLDGNNDKITATLNLSMSQSNVAEIDLALAGFDEKLILQYVTNKFAADIISDLSCAELDDMLTDHDMTYYICQHHRDDVIENLAHITKHKKFVS